MKKQILSILVLALFSMATISCGNKGKNPPPPPPPDPEKEKEALMKKISEDADVKTLIATTEALRSAVKTKIKNSKLTLKQFTKMYATDTIKLGKTLAFNNPEMGALLTTLEKTSKTVDERYPN